VRFLLATCLLLSALVVLSGYPVFSQEQHTLRVTIQPHPQANQVISLGVYDTLFPVDLSVVIENPSQVDFPGGNLTGRVSTPSQRWQVPIQYAVPKLSPGATVQYPLTFRPQEAGLYIVSVDTISTRVFYNPIWTVEDGFLALEIEPPSTLIEVWSVMIALFVGFASIALSVVLPYYRDRRRSRDLEERKSSEESALRVQLLAQWASEMDSNLKSLSDPVNVLGRLIVNDRPLDRIAIQHVDLVEKMTDLRRMIVDLNSDATRYDLVLAPQIAYLTIPEPTTEQGLTPDDQRELQKSRQVKKWQHDMLELVATKRKEMIPRVQELLGLLTEAIKKERLAGT
jgi:hypothetical protein